MDFGVKREASRVQESIIQNRQQFGETSIHYMLHPEGNQLHQDEDIKPVVTQEEHHYPSSSTFCNDSHFSSVSLESSERNPSTTKGSPKSRIVDLGDQCAESKENFDPMKYTCGGCNTHFGMICQLHHHLLNHLESGSYIYNITTKTAYPRYDSICRAVQTSDSKHDVLIDNPIQEQDENSENEMAEDVIEEQNKLDWNREERKVFGHSSKGLVKKKRKAERLNDKRNGNALLSLIKNSKFERKLSENYKNRTLGKKLKLWNPGASEMKADTDMNPSSSAVEKDITDKLKQDQGSEKGLLYTGYCFDDDLVDEKKEKFMNDSDRDSNDSDTKLYNEDVDTNTGATEKKYKCEDCGRGFKSESKLDVHRFKKHAGVKKVLHECKWCNEVFMFKRQLLGHIVSCSRNEGLKCFICGEIFPRKADKMMHMTSHQNEEDLTCKICGKMVEKWQLMETHMKKRHWPKDVQCDKCGEAFQFKYELQRHKGSRCEEKPISCPKCDMKFRTIRAWRNHYLVHTDERPFVCQYCGYTAKKHEYLKRHIRIHTGEKPFSCQICGMAFRAMNDLNRHNKVHTNKKHCVCQYCGKAFASNWNLKTHIRQHTGDTPYKCSECGQGFKQNVLVKLHMKSHHPNV